MLCILELDGIPSYLNIMNVYLSEIGLHNTYILYVY